MAHILIPVQIKPYLVPFLYKNLECVSTTHKGKEIKAAKVTDSSHLGRFIRLLLEKSTHKPACDKSVQTFLLVQEVPRILEYMRPDYKYEDGRKAYLHLPLAGEKLVNEFLEEDFETAQMFFIHARHKSDSDESLDAIILDFFSKYNLEEFGFNTLRIRRNYYRKVKAGYFKATVFFDPISATVRAAK